ncbi:Stk1 family PASTA domain-containing Ser/Thr kinase [Demetria terragena]|uniref:Stk1 family PASTA domain-containing Ser/Thr kinase n=1 Tax=Demetria terragena TaxID=63959 RepID=UPI00036BFE12|nr:Stk1 family PASTA domain-containing Ser/Thr kinase [Demetria terragena]
MSTPPHDSLVDQTVDGRYVVRGYLAKGGMASVYIAMDTRLDREVALKVMRTDLAEDDEFVARFRREARAAARLSHPNVVGVFDQGRDGTRVFLAMELVRGRTLRELIRTEGVLTPRAALDLLDQVLQALGAAHRADTVHRDVKPENVLISHDGAVKVADFGLARALTTDTLTTNHDILLGTAAYLAPEQVEHGRADKRSDVYSATLLLHEMLTGQKAFSGDSPIHVAYQHVHGDVPRPSAVLPGVPAELDVLVALGAAKSPEQRPDDALEMLRQVRATRAQLSGEDLDQLPAGLAPHSADGTDGRTQAISGVSTNNLRHGRKSAPPAAAPATPAARPRRTGGRRLVGGLAALVLVVGGAGWWFGLGPGSASTIPNIQGQPQGKAIDALDQAGLSAQVDEVFSESVPKGRVVASSPKAGADQRRSDPVTLRVSRGPERLSVPKVVGATQDKATTRITDARLAVGKVTQEFSETVAKGAVISSDPGRGDDLKPGAKVDLVVSKGREPISIPDVSNQSQQAAESTLTELGLKVKMAEPKHHDSVPKGDVISSEPSNGTVFRGDTVTLTISKGPEMVKVPSVINKNTASARKILEGAGFTVDVSRFLGGVLDTVRGQTPSPGTSVRKGTKIKITVV